MTANLSTEHYEINPRELTLLTKNARRMPQRQFRQLVENVKADGVLTSAPLIHRGADGKLLVLSGNHRVKAAIAAGLKTVLVLEVKGDLDAERLLAIQLSHNALAGEDDQNILAELYQSLGALGKLYSGLTDADFGGIAELDLSKLAIGAPSYEQVQPLFLPEDRETFVTAMEKLGKGAARASRYIARLTDFKAFEDALVAVQDSMNIHNQALAVLSMAELAMERLAQLEKADGHASDDGRPTAEQSSDDQAGGGGAPPKRRRHGARGGAVEGQPLGGDPVRPEA